MSKINYQELREAAEQATQDEWVAYILPGHNGIYPARTSEGTNCGYFIDWPGIDGQRNAGANARYIAAIPPKVALALLDKIKHPRTQILMPHAVLRSLRLISRRWWQRTPG